MSTQMKRMLIIVGIIFGLVFGYYIIKQAVMGYFMSHFQPPPVTVSATDAQKTTWQSYLTSVGTLTAVNGVDVSAEVQGIVKEIRFQSGQNVNAGDVLVLLDTNIEQAQLKDNQARLKLAQVNYERNKTLFQKKVTSLAVLDTSYAELQQAEAGVEATQAKIKQKTLTAPFSGKIGIRLVDLGQYIQAGTAIVTLQSLDPLYVRFNLPEQYLPEIYLGQPVDVVITAEKERIVKGKVTAINSKVDQTTRNILVEATIPNAKQEFYPGMFGLVKVWLRTQSNVVTIPETAVSFSLHGDAVYLIKSDKDDDKILKAFRQYVKVGEHRENRVVIKEGIKPGDKVVTSGQLKLQNGARVAIDNSVELQ